MPSPKYYGDELCLTVAEVGKELYENRIRLSDGHPAVSIEMAIRALEAAYEIALSHYQKINDVDLDAVPDKWASRPPLPSGAIQSKNMQRCEGLLETDLKGGTFSGWLTLGKTEFEHQIFDRTELQRWVEANGVVPPYRFDGVKADTNVPASAAILATAPVVPTGVIGGVNWTLKKPQRFPGYTKPLYDLLKAAHITGQPRPKARDVLDKWKENPPPDVAEVTDNGLKYYDAKGNTKPADLGAIRKAIGRMVR